MPGRPTLLDNSRRTVVAVDAGGGCFDYCLPFSLSRSSIPTETSLRAVKTKTTITIGFHLNRVKIASVRWQTVLTLIGLLVMNIFI